MKRNRTLPGKSTVVTGSRWLAYATAGASSAFISAKSAEATIHYSGPINEWVGAFRHEQFPLDQHGDSIGLKHYQIFSGGYGGSARFGVFGKAGAAFAGVYHNCSGNPQAAFVANLGKGELVSNQQFLGRESGFVWASGWVSCGTYHGQFKGEQTGYVGFKFNNGGGEQYGWARIVVGGIDDRPVKLLDYAYGDVGDRIKVGQKPSNDVATDKGSLGLLAVGAVGLLVWRKRRSGSEGAQL